ncbi:unnamed protein product [Ceutorhynchus assimilis]|uniref:Uncharacterized protein n=1 Tax=Ceutorhynchus assimilis TaxID=467358 RepID=A0A9N9QDH8_9CUCU|nr:unnamed protein product [Ceutorhynchus assimilis]
MPNTTGYLSNKDQLEEIKKLIIASSNDLSSKIEKVNDDLIKENHVLKHKIKTLEDKNQDLELKINILEIKARKNNLIIYGLPNKTELKGENLVRWVVDKLKNLLEVDLNANEINNTYYLGRPETEKKPLLVELTTYIRKDILLKNARKLKGKSVFLSNDLTKAEREINKVLYSNLKEARKLGLTAFIKKNNLHVGNDIYIYEDLLQSDIFKSTSGDLDEDVFYGPPPRRSVSVPGLSALSLTEDDSNDFFVAVDDTPEQVAATPIEEHKPANLQENTKTGTDDKKGDKQDPRRKVITRNPAAVDTYPTKATRSSSRSTRQNIAKNLDELLIFIKGLDEQFDVIVLTETFIIYDPSQFHIPDYDFIYNDSRLNRNDGTVVFIRKIQKDMIGNEEIEIQTCSSQLKSRLHEKYSIK